MYLMRRTRTASFVRHLIAVVFLLVQVLPILARQSSLDNSAIIKMVKAGLPDDVIIGVVKQQHGQFDLSPEKLIEFKTAGVSDKVLAALVGAAEVPVAKAAKGIEPQKFYLLGADNTLTPLLLEVGTTKTKSKLGGLGGVTVATEIMGAKALIRVKAGSAQTFLLGMPPGSLPDPPQPGLLWAQLLKLEIKGNTRQNVEIDRTGYGGLGKSRTTNAAFGIPLNFTRFDTQSMKIEPRMALPPGEYAFIANVPKDPYATLDQVHFYSFGVD